MKYLKKILSILTVLTFSFGIFAGCMPESGNDVSGTNYSDFESSKTMRTTQNQTTNSVVSSDASEIQPSDTTDLEQTNTTETTDVVVQNKEYTTLTLEDDFPVGYVQLKINTEVASWKGYRVVDFPEVDCIGLLDSTRYDKAAPRTVIIVLTDLSKEGTLSAIKTLEQRDDVLGVKPVTEEYVDGLFEPNYAFREQEYHPDIILGEVVVTLYPSASRKTYTKEDFSEVNCTDLDQSYASFACHYTFGITIEDKTWEGTVAAAEKIAQREDVQIVSFNGKIYLDSPPIDYVPSEVDLQEDLYWPINRLGLPQAWDITTGSPDITVGIIDTGIDATHYELNGQVSSTLSKCFGDESKNPLVDDVDTHGTHVAGIIGAKPNNGGMVGVCWGTTLVSLRIFYGDSDGGGTKDTRRLSDAIEYAESVGIDIINLSASGFINTPQLENAIRNYSGLFVCSAGNSGINLNATPRYPGSYQLDNMIVVGASTETNTVWPSSNYGSSIVDIFAPGDEIFSCLPGNSFTLWPGTSMATPYVAGVAALVLSISPNMTPQAVKALILDNGVYYSSFAGKCKTGRLLNAQNAIEELVHEHSYTSRTESTGSNTQHRAYCNCGEYILQNHSFTKNLTSTGSSQHRAYCDCGSSVIQNHAYTHYYEHMSTVVHRAYCKCGAYQAEGHTYTGSGSVRTCTKCGYSAELNNVEPKPEIE